VFLQSTGFVIAIAIAALHQPILFAQLHALMLASAICADTTQTVSMAVAFSVCSLSPCNGSGDAKNEFRASWCCGMVVLLHL
jgi:hypothetical protein